MASQFSLAGHFLIMLSIFIENTQKCATIKVAKYPHSKLYTRQALEQRYDHM